MDKPTVRICATCQKINDPKFVSISSTIDPQIKKEMKVVDLQVKAKENNFAFSHTFCVPHYMIQLKDIPEMTEERLKLMAQQAEHNNPVPCLLTNAAVRHAYMRGLFTPELIQQAAEKLKQSNHQLTERFKKLSGIKS